MPTLVPPPGRIAAAAGILVACVACDQATKAVAVARLPDGHRVSLLGDCVRLELLRNAGAFLGLGGALPDAARAVIFTWGVGLLVVAALVAAFHPRSSTRTSLAAALAAAGGIGNLWDRVATGGWVVDFMNVGIGPLRTGVFNVADVAIMVGVVLLALAPATSGRGGAAGERARDPRSSR